MKKLLLLHGALGAAADFDPLLPLLSARYQCFAPDLPGHGRSLLQLDTFSIEAFAAFLSDYIVQNDLAGCHVFGYSMGGYISSYLQVTKPTFSSIYTLGTKFIWTRATAQKEASFLNPAKMTEKVPAYTSKLMRKHSHGDWQQLVQKTADLMRLLGHSPALPAIQFAKINIPVAVGLGDRDKMIPFADAVAVFNHLPEACLDILPHTQHPLDLVNLTLIANRLDYFFDLYH